MTIRFKKDRIEFEDVLFNANPFKILSGGLSARGCEIIFKELSKTLNYKITPRNLRQSCVFRWLAQDINHISIKEWLGVRPSYSLKPFIILMEEVNVHTFVEIQEKII